MKSVGIFAIFSIILLFSTAFGQYPIVPFETPQSEDIAHEMIIAVDDLILRNTSTCEICQVAFKYAESFLGDPDFQNYLISIFDEVCSHNPDYASQCQRITSFLIPHIINIIENEPPQFVCEKLGVCKFSPFPISWHRIFRA